MRTATQGHIKVLPFTEVFRPVFDASGLNYTDASYEIWRVTGLKFQPSELSKYYKGEVEPTWVKGAAAVHGLGGRLAVDMGRYLLALHFGGESAA